MADYLKNLNDPSPNTPPEVSKSDGLISTLSPTPRLDKISPEDVAREHLFKKTIKEYQFKDY